MKKIEYDEDSFNKLYKKYCNKDPNKIKTSQAKALLQKDICKKFKFELEETQLDDLLKSITSSAQLPDELNKEQFQVFFFKSTWNKIDLAENLNMVKLNLIEKAESRHVFVTEKSVFGVDVSISAERSDLEFGITPSVIKDGLDLLNRKGLREEGLWRIPGNFSVYMKYREQYDNGLSVDLSGILEPTNVTSILVNYFKHTPESIFTKQYKPMFEHLLETENFSINIDIPNTNPEPYQQLRFLMVKIPVTNREILRLMIEHLRKVFENRKENLMNIDALSICFGILMGSTISKLLMFVVSHYEYFDYLVPKTTVFGYSLEEGVKIANSIFFKSKHEVPIPISKCIEWLNKKTRDSSLWVESGDFIKVKKLCKRFDSAEDFEIDESEDPDIVASCLKHYFAKSPDLLFGGKDFYNEEFEVLKTIPEESQKVEKLREILGKLPVVNQSVIKVLSSHFSKHCKEHEKDNNVKPHVLCPILYRALIHPVVYYDKLYL